MQLRSRTGMRWRWSNLPVCLSALSSKSKFFDGRVRHSGPTFEFTGGTDEFRIDEQGVKQISRAFATRNLTRCAIATRKRSMVAKTC